MMTQHSLTRTQYEIAKRAIAMSTGGKDPWVDLGAFLLHLHDLGTLDRKPYSEVLSAFSFLVELGILDSNTTQKDPNFLANFIAIEATALTDDRYVATFTPFY